MNQEDTQILLSAFGFDEEDAHTLFLAIDYHEDALVDALKTGCVEYTFGRSEEPRQDLRVRVAQCILDLTRRRLFRVATERFPTLLGRINVELSHVRIVPNGTLLDYTAPDENLPRELADIVTRNVPDKEAISGVVRSLKLV